MKLIMRRPLNRGPLMIPTCLFSEPNTPRTPCVQARGARISCSRRPERKPANYHLLSVAINKR